MIHRRFFYALALLAVVGFTLVVSDFSEARPQYLRPMALRYPQLVEKIKKAKCGICHPGKHGKTTAFSYAFEKGLSKKNEKDEEAIDKAFEQAEDMEYKDGKTFGEILKAGGLPVEY